MAGRPLCGAVLGAVTTRLTVTVPVAIKGGELVRVAAPDGSYHSVMVPAGLTTGQQFSVELLAGDAEGDDAAELATIKVELEAERQARREAQHEALRARTALERSRQKRKGEHAMLREMIKRQRRAIEQLTSKLGQ